MEELNIMLIQIIKFSDTDYHARTSFPTNNPLGVGETSEEALCHLYTLLLQNKEKYDQYTNWDWNKVRIEQVDNTGIGNQVKKDIRKVHLGGQVILETDDHVITYNGKYLCIHENHAGIGRTLHFIKKKNNI